MNHIYDLPEFGENWFDYNDIYKLMVEKFPSESKFVEVGSWKGKSAAYLAVEIINSKKNITLDCIDTWEGSSEHVNYEHVKSNSLYELFIKNTSSLSNVINPIRMDSINASKKYENNSIDFIFIDASHEYDFVKKDIEAWFPKVKIGGIIAGHDYKTGWIGVDKAVDEFFVDKKILISRSSWIYQKI
jgi:predicted O-methyltransferase YrrM